MIGAALVLLLYAAGNLVILWTGELEQRRIRKQRLLRLLLGIR